MTDLAKDAQERAAVASQEKAARKATNGSKKKAVKATAQPAPESESKVDTVTATQTDPVPVAVQPVTEAQTKPAKTKPVKPVTVGGAPQTRPESAKPKQPIAEKDQKILSLPKPLSGVTPVYMLFAAPRSTNVADNRRNESLNNMQSQLFLGVSLDRALLESAKARYTKDNPDLYFWISTKKALGEAPKNMRLALQHENLLVAHGMM